MTKIPLGVWWLIHLEGRRASREWDLDRVRNELGKAEIFIEVTWGMRGPKQLKGMLSLGQLEGPMAPARGNQGNLEELMDLTRGNIGANEP